MFHLQTLLLGVAVLLWNITGIASASFLSPSTPIDVSSGFGSSSGSVGVGHSIFQFDADQGDVVSIAVMVTEIFPGTGFTDDDTELFLFDAVGKLLAENDDALDPFESLIEGFRIATNGSYFVGVTTFDNKPLFDSNGVGIGWMDNGQSSVEFDLLIFRSQSVPEPSSILLCIVGAISVFCWKSRRIWN